WCAWFWNILCDCLRRVEIAEKGVGEVEARLAKERHEHDATRALLRDETKKREDNERGLEHALEAAMTSGQIIDSLKAELSQQDGRATYHSDLDSPTLASMLLDIVILRRQNTQLLAAIEAGNPTELQLRVHELVIENGYLQRQACGLANAMARNNDQVLALKEEEVNQ
ncbi:hypothetical protein LTS18_007238, partial [Coniosporium uncinatum]